MNEIEFIRRYFADPEWHIRENDRTWGAGNWILCLRAECRTPDGKPTFHHAEAHA